MALHAQAVEILIEKGRFEPEVALGIAEAMDVSIMNAQLVTVAILDSRLAKVDLRFVEVETKIDQLRLEMNAKFDQVSAKFDQVNAKFDQQRADFQASLERTKAELVRWVFVVVLGNVALTASVTAIMNALRSF